MTSVLMVLTTADHWTLNDGTEHPSGFWDEEFVVPYEVFTRAGWDIERLVADLDDPATE